MINTVAIAGHLGNDPELKVVGTEQISVCNFSVAVKGFDKDSVVWVNVTTWRATAEFCGTYLKKGSFVVCQGRLQQDTWQEGDGTKRSILKVVADSVESPKTK